MIAYKLFRKRKDNNISSLFINKSRLLEKGKWLGCKSYPTKGFKVRNGWHCLGQPKTPHLSNKNRIWYKIEIKDYKELNRPKYQGKNWYIAKKIKILKPV